MANKILKIATWNANGLLNHKQEVITFVDLNKIGILLVSKSHFTDNLFLNTKLLFLHNYSSRRNSSWWFCSYYKKFNMT